MTAPSRTLGKYERLYLERHERDLALAAAPGGHPRGLRFDLEAGERVVRFVEGYCQHHKGEWAGRPFALDDWQRQWILIAFGWRRADGTRRFRIMYVEIPRKNGKSTLAAALGLYLLIADHEPGAEIYASATKEKQARIVWDEAAKTIKKSPKLSKHVKAFRSSIVCERTGSKFEPLGSDSDTQDGLNPHGNIVDELHAHRDRGMWDVLDTAMGARRQPLTLAITTAGTYDPESIGWQIHDQATKVLEGVYEDDSFFAFIASAEKDEEFLKKNPAFYFSEEAQRQANPGYGISVKPDHLKGQAEKARRQPSFTNEYLRLHLNVWPQQVTRWLSLEDWASCEDISSTMVAAELRAISTAREQSLVGRKCWGGLDLSTKLDLAACALVFPSEKGDEIDVVCRFWLPERTVEKYAEKGRRHYEAWVRDGWIVTTPGDVIDYEYIRRDVNELAKTYALQEMAFDPWGATDLSTRLTGDGLQMVETRQGYKSLSEPSKDLEARVVSRKVRHAGNPVLRFCVSNAVITRDSAGNIKPDKEKASDKIDGVVAVVMALSRILCAQEEQPSPYEERGIRLL